jgi:chromosomal replication initiator protein
MLPSAETRQRIVQAIGRAWNIQLSAAAEQLLCSQTSMSVPELQGIIQRCAADRVRPTDGPRSSRLTLDVHDLEAGWPDTASPAVEPRRVIRATAQYFGLPLRNVTGASRRRLDVLARSLAMYLIRDLIGESFQQIGHWFSRRDHTTVMHACRKIALDLDQDAVTRQAVLDIRRTLTNGAHEGRGTVRDAPRRGKRVRWA